jgi:hypothetical protein
MRIHFPVLVLVAMSIEAALGAETPVGHGDRQCAARSASVCAFFTSSAAVVHQTLVPFAARPCPIPLATGQFSTRRQKFRPGLSFSFRI